MEGMQQVVTEPEPTRQAVMVHHQAVMELRLVVTRQVVTAHRQAAMELRQVVMERRWVVKAHQLVVTDTRSKLLK